MVNEILEELELKCIESLDHLHQEFAKIQTGRANAALVEGIMVDSYGAKVPLRGVATITIPEPTQIAIQPFSKDQLVNVEKAVREADLGINPQNDGNYIRLNIPPLTEERRRDLVKLVNKIAENSRISIRNARHEALGSFKKMEKEKQISEDELKSREKIVQDKVDKFNEKIEESTKKKESDIMTV